MGVRASLMGRPQPRSEFLYDTQGTCRQTLTIPFVIYGSKNRKKIEEDIRFYCRSRSLQHRLDTQTNWLFSRHARYLLVVEGSDADVNALLDYVRNHPVFR